MTLPVQPLRVTCNSCGTEGFTYDGSNPDAAVTCACCPADHDHAAAANACPGGHEGQPCPCADPVACSVTPEGVACEGGHCGAGVPGCAVCRPVTIYAVAYLTGEASQ